MLSVLNHISRERIAAVCAIWLAGCAIEQEQRPAEAKGGKPAMKSVEDNMSRRSCSKPGHIFCKCLQLCAPEAGCRAATEGGNCESDPPPPFRAGFYKAARPEVYLVYRGDQYCHVQNDDQMAAYGGYDQVRTPSRLSLSGLRSTGDCGWPNGFFKRSGKADVYRMYGTDIPAFNVGDTYCHVVNEKQMNDYGGFGLVREVLASSDLGRGRRFTGECVR